MCTINYYIIIIIIIIYTCSSYIIMLLVVLFVSFCHKKFKFWKENFTRSSIVWGHFWVTILCPSLPIQRYIIIIIIIIIIMNDGYVYIKG